MSLVTEPLREIILFVQDMESEVRFYRDVLGLKISFPSGLADYSGEMWVEFSTGDCTLALHAGAKEKPASQHEIIFKVDDVHEARKVIVAAGIHMEAVRDLEDGAPISEGIDPAGHRFAIRT